jgi:hypothetical protein
VTGHRCGTYVARARARYWSRSGSRGAGRLLTCEGNTRAGDGNRTRIASLEGVWRTGVRAVELETLMLVSSRGYPLLTMVNGPLMAWRSWPDSYRSRPVRAAAPTSPPWCCSPLRALPGASSAWPLSGWTRPLLPPTRLLPNPGTDGFCQGRLRVYINHAPLTGSGCPTVTDGLDRFRESQILLRRVGGRPPTFPPAYGRREAEPHRSRTVSLGIGPIIACNPC